VTALNKKLFRDLWRIRGQALAVAFVIGGGIATLVMSLSAIDSLQETRRAYYQQYRFGDVFASAKRAPQRIMAEIGAIPGVVRAQSRIVQDIIIDVADMREPARGRVVSRKPGESFRLNDIVIRRGRDLRPGNPDEILVNEAFAQAHGLALGDIIHGNINQRRRALTIVGVVLSPEFVYAIGPGEIVPDDRRFGILWMSRDGLEAAYDLKGAFNNVTLRLARDASEAEIITRLDRLLRRYGGTGAIGRADQVSDAFVTSELAQLGNLATVIPPVFLAVAAFLFNIVMTRIVQTEREQIGVLKAFGYRNAEIGWLYLKLAMAITLLGILIGWGAGAWMGGSVTALYGEFFRFPFLQYVVDPGTFLVGAVVSIAAAAVGTFAAVRQAVIVTPAVAMTPAAPSAYRASMMEWFGITNAMSQSARMIVRHILRWPLRAALTVTGVALSVAILITSLFFLDGVNAMMQFQFFDSEHQDMSFTFVDPRPGAVRTDLDDLPGVLAVETFRVVAAKLRLGHREERVAIRGIQPRAELSVLMDANRVPVRMPSRGIVLSDKLAQMLAARKGDLVTVSALEGRRPVRQVLVMRIVSQYVGLAAYMDRRALNRLMGEGDVVSGADVLTDRLAQPALYSALKKTPELLGLSVRRSSLQTFRDMIDEHLNTMVFFYVAFASLISVGVVYNSARISLSERARELASLRVLGYTRREVGTILAGELAILTLIALPLGSVAGYGMAGLMVKLFDTKLYRVPFIIEPATYGYAVVVVLAAAIVSSWLVLRRVATLDLIAVLKTRE
jgi:putative ABC transport system permease protein